MIQTEINGHKFEIEEPVATRVSTLRVGSKVRVLHKPRYGSMNIYVGVVLGFEPFPTLPTVRVAYIDTTKEIPKVTIIPFNEKTEEYELVTSLGEEPQVVYENAIEVLERRVEKAQAEVAKAREDLTFFTQAWHRLPAQV